MGIDRMRSIHISFTQVRIILYNQLLAIWLATESFRRKKINKLFIFYINV
jgi:hypothetical protein